MLPNDCDRRIGPAGRAARLGLGLALIALEVFWRDPKWWDPVLGLVIVPGVLLAIAAARAHRGRGALRATGPVGHFVNIAIFLVAITLPVTAGAAMLFYGGSMLVAAATANGGCEVTAIPNLLLRRDDQVGCALFGPVDAAERSLASRPLRG